MKKEQKKGGLQPRATYEEGGYGYLPVALGSGWGTA